jgi:hypothetical protein
MDKEQDSKESPELNNPETDEVKVESPPEFDQRFEKLRSDLTDQVNGVAKKLESAIAKLAQSSTPKEETKNKSTLEALREEFESKSKLLEEKLTAQETLIRERETKALQSEIEKKTVLLFSRKDAKGNELDDVQEAFEDFSLRYPVSKFVEDNGVILFQTDKGTKTLESLVIEWRESKTGKRYIKAAIKPGTGIKEGDENNQIPESPKRVPGQIGKPRRTLTQIQEELSSGKSRIKS